MKLIRHLHNVNIHRFYVFILCCKVGIPFQGLVHDLSKYSLSELVASVKYFTDGTKSPLTTDKSINGYSLAWLHHKGHNKHHFEYWYDYNAKIKTPVIPFKYMKEMICDRIAASKVYYKNNYNDSCSIEYFNSHKNEIRMDERLISYLEDVFTRLSKEGESFLNNKNLKELYLKHLSK